MGSNLSLRGVWVLPQQKKIRNMKCSRSDSRPILGLLRVSSYVTFGVYRFWRAYIDGYSALGVVYKVSLEVVMTTHA